MTRGGGTERGVDVAAGRDDLAELFTFQLVYRWPTSNHWLPHKHNKHFRTCQNEV